MEQNIEAMFGIPHTILGSQEWQEIEQKENTIGPDDLLNEIIDKKIWNNAEIMWVIKRLIYFYGKNDSLLKKAPTERLFTNILDILKVFFLIFDINDPDLDPNMRSYICSKMGDSTWGVSTRTREYLYKIKDK
ncbi:MAG: hypothetical protein PHC92_00350 [Syntrophomonadaceae bacterium]|nr:hypothetical protein [Syntrophomonadaceae bacterium]MDD3022363.1 hypothetical protein [Syntrophomonadaceae bacterium]